jgi:hypothetical protein
VQPAAQGGLTDIQHFSSSSQRLGGIDGMHHFQVFDRQAGVKHIKNINEKVIKNQFYQ